MLLCLLMNVAADQTHDPTRIGIQDRDRKLGANLMGGTATSEVTTSFSHLQPDNTGGSAYKPHPAKTVPAKPRFSAMLRSQAPRVSF
jgi:hypothetical protein